MAETNLLIRRLIGFAVGIMIIFAAALLCAPNVSAAVSISSCEIGSIADKTYTGAPITPSPVVKYKSSTLKRGTDYELSFSSNTNAGTAYVTVIGKGNFSGMTSRKFTIKPVSVFAATYYKISDRTYTGSVLKPVPQIKFGGRTLKNGTDFTLDYTSNVKAGRASVTITGKGNFTGRCMLYFNIKKRSASTLSISTEKQLKYTGKAQKPAVTVKCGDNTLINGTDYTLTYKNNTRIGTGTVTVTGKGSVYGSVTLSFRIYKDLSAAKVSCTSSRVYSGKAIKPDVTVTLDGKTLVKDKDYTVTYKNNKNVGTASVIVTGINKYGDKVKKTFKIKPAPISGCTVSVGSGVYTAKAVTPAVTVKRSGKQLINGTDYTLYYANNKNVGTATLVVTGKGNYTGTVSRTFKIKPADISECTVKTISSAVYSGAAIKPEVTVKFNGTVLKKNTAYTVSYSGNKYAGTAVVTVNGKGNFSGSVEKTFKIKKAYVSSAVITVEPQYFSGGAVKPLPKVVLNGHTLKKGTDYTLSYKNNKDIGSAVVTVTGKGSLKGSAEAPFNILSRPLNADMITVKDAVYSGKKQTPAVTVSYGGYVFEKGVDYKLSYLDNVNAGTATVKISGIGKCSGTVKKTFKISRRNISAAVCKAQLNDDGTLAVTLTLDGKKLEYGSDYTYETYEEDDCAYLKFIGLDNYTGELCVKTDILTDDIKITADDLNVEVAAGSVFTGSAVRPEVNVSVYGRTLKKDSAYLLSYSDNVNAGTASVTVVGLNSLYGVVKTVSFDIAPADINACAVVCPDCRYTGSALCPVPEITLGDYTLVQDTDFTLTYKNNKNIGKGTVCVTGKGNFTKSAEVTFAITAETPQSEVRRRLDEMMEGKHDRTLGSYVHSYKTGNYFNTLLTEPCTCHDRCIDGSESFCTCLIGRSTVLQNFGIQCCGFTLEVFEYLFGGTNGAGENTLRKYNSSDMAWNEANIKKALTANLRSGDYLAYTNVTGGYDHYVIVYSVESDGIWVYEANYGGRCKINFRKMTFKEICEDTDDLWHRTPDNYALS